MIEACPVIKYKISKSDLEYINNILNDVDGPSPYAVFDINNVRESLANNRQVSANCIVKHINNIILTNPELSSYNIYAHVKDGNVMFDRIKPIK
jgi:hypothetical protein